MKKTPSDYLTRKQVVQKLTESRGGKANVELAEDIGISPQLLSDIFAYRRKPGTKVLEYLSRNRKLDVLAEVEAYQYVKRGDAQ